MKTKTSNRMRLALHIRSSPGIVIFVCLLEAAHSSLEGIPPTSDLNSNLDRVLQLLAALTPLLNSLVPSYPQNMENSGPAEDGSSKEGRSEQAAWQGSRMV